MSIQINKKQGANLFPYMEPTKCFKIEELEEIKNYNKMGIYVLWDKPCYEKDRKRYDYQFEDFPLYIGKSKDLGDRVFKHITGKTHISPISIYIYGVDFYDIEELIHNNKELKDINTANQLRVEGITDLLELYFIMRRLTYFNYQSNYFLSENFGQEEYSKKRSKTRRNSWKDAKLIEVLKNNKTEIEPMISIDEFCKKISKGWKNKSKIAFLSEYVLNEFNTKWGNDSEALNDNGTVNLEKEFELKEKRKESFLKKEDGEFKIPLDEILYFKKDNFDNLYEKYKQEIIKVFN